MKKIIALALALLTVFFFTACVDSPNVDEDISSEPISSEVQSDISSEPISSGTVSEPPVFSDISSETVSDVTSEELLSEVESGPKKPSVIPKLENEETYIPWTYDDDFQYLPKFINRADSYDAETLNQILDIYNDLSSMFEIYPPREPSSKYRLGTRMLFLAAGDNFENFRRGQSMPVEKIKEKYPETDTFAGIGVLGYINGGYPFPKWLDKKYFDETVDKYFCKDCENIDFTDAERYYCKEENAYSLPVWGSETTPLPILFSYQEVGENMVEADFGFFLYCGALDDHEFYAQFGNDFDNTEVGRMYVNWYNHSKDGEVKVLDFNFDEDCLDKICRMKYTFCRTDEGLKLHSIKTVK